MYFFHKPDWIQCKRYLLKVSVLLPGVEVMEVTCRAGSSWPQKTDFLAGETRLASVVTYQALAYKVAQWRQSAPRTSRKGWISSICRSWKRLYGSRDWSGILLLDGLGGEGYGNLRQEKQCKVDPASTRNTGPARAKSLCLVIEKAQLSPWDKVKRKPEGSEGGI